MELVKASDYGLTEQQGSEISNRFKILGEEKKALITEYQEIITKELTVELSTIASLLDKKLQKHLKAKKDIHTANKSFFLNGGRFVDSIYNMEKVEFGIMRDAAQKIKNYAENLEKERIEKLNKSRIELVRKYIDDADNLFLADMDEDVFEAYLSAKKTNYEARIKAEFDLENERIAAAKAEQQRLEEQRIENIRLKKESEQRDKEIEKERLQANEKEQQREKEQKIKDDKIKEELKAKEDEKEKLRLELKAKDDAENKRIEEEKARIILEEKEAEARLQAQLNKGDAEKIIDLTKDLSVLKTKYSFESKKNKQKYIDVSILLDKVINHVNN
jgi:hypothetical protein